MPQRIRIKRGTAAQLQAAATANQLAVGEIYLITNENRLAVAIANNAFSRMQLLNESRSFVEMTATQASTVTALADVTQLVLPLLANSLYKIECFVIFHSANNNTGLNLALLTPTGSRNMVEIVVPVSNTAAASQLRLISPSAAIASNDSSVLGTAVTGTASNHTAMISGMIRTAGTAGNCQIRFASENAGTAVTLQIGSTLFLEKIG